MSRWQEERDWWSGWSDPVRRLALWAVIALAAFWLGTLLHGAPVPVHPEKEIQPHEVKGADFNGEWAMKWNSSPFRQTLDKSGFAECLGDSNTFIGTWTSAKAGELTISETHHSLPCYTRAGEEITFTFAVTRAVRKGRQIVRIEAEGPYQGGKVKIVLTPFVFK